MKTVDAGLARRTGDGPRPPRRRPLVWLFGSAATGILLAQAFPAPRLWCLAVALSALTASLALGWRRARRTPVAPVLILGLVAAAFAAYTSTRTAAEVAAQNRFPAGVRVPMLATGVVLDAPTPLSSLAAPGARQPEVPPGSEGARFATDSGAANGLVPVRPGVRRRRGFEPPWRSVFRLRVECYSDGYAPLAGASEVIQVYADARWPDLAPGERVTLALTLDTPRPPSTPGAFSYRRWLRERGIARLAHWRTANTPERLGIGGTWWDGYLARVRARLVRAAYARLDDREAALFLTLTIGTRAGLAPDVKRRFREAGTMHLLVISGLHLGFLVLIGHGILTLLRLPRRARAVLLMALIVGFWSLAEDRVGVTRAAAMGLLYYGGELSRRPPDFYNGLAGAALIVLALNPHDLTHAGFVLSFSAVFWLGMLGLRGRRAPAADADPAIEDATAGFAALVGIALNGAWATLRVSAAVFLGTAPIVWHVFAHVAPGALVMNVLAVPMMLWVLAGGLVTLLLEGLVVPGLMFVGLGSLAGGVEQAVGSVAALSAVGLRALLAAVDWVRAIPGSHGYLPPPPLIAVLFLQAVLLAWGARQALRLPVRRAALITVLAALPVAIAVTGNPRVAEPRVTVFDLGHSSAAAIETPGGQLIVVDPGNAGTGDLVRQALAPWMLGRGYRQVDLLVLSHAQRDHARGVRALTEVLPIRRALVTPQFFTHPAGARYLQPLDEVGVPVLVARPGMRLDAGGVWLEVWGPAPGLDAFTGGDRNEGSIVLAAYAVRRADAAGGGVPEHETAPAALGPPVVFTGDLGEYGIDALLASGRPQAAPSGGVLLVPHHGGANPQLGALLRALRPRLAVVPSSQASAPATRRALARGALAVHRTWRDGTLELRYDRAMRRWRRD